MPQNKGRGVVQSADDYDTDSLFGKLMLYSRWRAEIFPFTNVSRSALAHTHTHTHTHTQPLIHWVPDAFAWAEGKDYRA
jgi:hypothetical protein